MSITTAKIHGGGTCRSGRGFRSRFEPILVGRPSSASRPRARFPPVRLPVWFAHEAVNPSTLEAMQSSFSSFQTCVRIGRSRATLGAGCSTRRTPGGRMEKQHGRGVSVSNYVRMTSEPSSCGYGTGTAGQRNVMFMLDRCMCAKSPSGGHTNLCHPAVSSRKAIRQARIAFRGPVVMSR
jgi:hypothetical protein